MARVALNAVRKVYDNGYIAVENASFEAADRELLVFVGPSGCGKSTLLRMIAGLESITGGTISIGDRVVNDVPPKSRNIAMVFQNYALYPHMTVYENMAFGLKLRGMPKGTIDERVRKAASMLALDGILDRTPRQLSGGQRQRVALGRALVREPAVFLLDEPLSNLDAKLRLQTRTEIARLHRQLGATMIYVTHDQVEAMTLGDRIVVLDKGKVQQIDTPMALYERPANRFVAGFIGSPAMNFIDGVIEAGEFRSDDGSVRVPLDAPARRVTLGVRPEDVEVGSGPIRATVELLEPVGNETFVYTRAGANAITARTAPRALPAGGETVSLDFDRSRVHLFDRETGERLPSSRA